MSAAPPPGLTAPSDAELLLGIAGRDRAAFVALFERYAGRIKAYALRAGSPAADADEIAQDVMVAVWRHAASFDPSRASPSTWIYAIARNRRIDAFRRAGRAVAAADDPLLQLAPAPDGFRLLDVAEREARLRAAVADLAPEQRTVLVAAFFEGMSHAGIAAREWLPLGTVKSRIRLAFRHLHAILGDDLAEGFGDG